MNNEIKEILNNLRYTAKKHTIQVLEDGGKIEHCPQEVATEIRLNTYSANILLDYITNLQQENERIKKMNMHEHKYGSDMEEKYLLEKEKNDRAVEYVKECYTQPPNIENFMHEGEMNYLLNILNGRSDE